MSQSTETFLRIEAIFHDLGFQPQTLSGALYHGPARRGIAAHEQRNTDDALIAHHGDLGGGAVLHHIQQRDDGGRWKVHMAQRAAGLIQHSSERHLDGLHLRQQARLHGIRQRCEQMILVDIVNSDVHRIA